MKKELRARFKRDQSVLVIGKLAAHFIKKLVKLDLDLTSRPFSYYAKKDKSNLLSSKRMKKDIDKFDLVILEWSLDDDIDLFTKNIFKRKDTVFPKNLIRLFRNIPDSDLRFLAKRAGLPFKTQKRGHFHEELDSLEARYPEIKHSLGSSIQLMSNLETRKP